MTHRTSQERLVRIFSIGGLVTKREGSRKVRRTRYHIGAIELRKALFIEQGPRRRSSGDPLARKRIDEVPSER